MAEQQTYANHTRWYPFVHFTIVPLLLLNLIYQAVRLYQEPSWDRVVFVAFCLVVTLTVPAARLQALKAQDRLIRLEERMRYREILGQDLAQRASELPARQIIALRFASDNELPSLVERTLAGEFAKPKEIKMAIKDWRGDYLRV